MSIIEIKNLSLSLNGKKILNDLSIDFWEGHIHAIVGPNGAGKSTLAGTIMGLSGYRHFEGDIKLKGKSIKKLNLDERARKGITMAWQEPARYEGLTVEQFLKAGAKDKSNENIKSILSKVGLKPESYLKRAVDKTLSGGERKKVEIASILAMQPEFVLMDEPDSGIDIASLENIFNTIKILKENGSTIVLITHSLAVLKQADHAFLMCGGKILEKGAAEKIIPYFEGKCLPCPHINVPDENIFRGDNKND